MFVHTPLLTVLPQFGGNVPSRVGGTDCTTCGSSSSKDTAYFRGREGSLFSEGPKYTVTFAVGTLLNMYMTYSRRGDDGGVCVSARTGRKVTPERVRP